VSSDETRVSGRGNNSLHTILARGATLTDRAHEQQASGLTQAEEQMSTSNEDDLQRDLKMRMQPIIQNYVNRTKRPLPIDLSLDMSAIVQLPQH
jgi:hypothetical protein